MNHCDTFDDEEAGQERDRRQQKRDLTVLAWCLIVSAILAMSLYLCGRGSYGKSNGGKGWSNNQGDGGYGGNAGGWGKSNNNDNGKWDNGKNRGWNDNRNTEYNVGKSRGWDNNGKSGGQSYNDRNNKDNKRSGGLGNNGDNYQSGGWRNRERGGYSANAGGRGVCSGESEGYGNNNSNNNSNSNRNCMNQNDEFHGLFYGVCMKDDNEADEGVNSEKKKARGYQNDGTNGEWRKDNDDDGNNNGKQCIQNIHIQNIHHIEIMNYYIYAGGGDSAQSRGCHNNDNNNYGKSGEWRKGKAGSNKDNNYNPGPWNKSGGKCKSEGREARGSNGYGGNAAGLNNDSNGGSGGLGKNGANNGRGNQGRDGGDNGRGQ